MPDDAGAHVHITILAQSKSVRVHYQRESLLEPRFVINNNDKGRVTRNQCTISWVHVLHVLFPPTWVGANTLLIGGGRHKTATNGNYVIKKDYCYCGGWVQY